MVNLATIGGGSAAVGAGVVGGFLFYWFEDTVFGRARNRKIVAVVVGAAAGAGTLYLLKDVAGIDLTGKPQ